MEETASMKYFCNDCEKTFDEERMDSGSDRYSTWYVCPNCHSTDVEECDICEMCGEYIEPHTMFCKDCAENIKITWENMIHNLSRERRVKYDDMQDMVMDWIEREVS